MMRRVAELFTDPVDMVQGLRREAGPGINLWGPSLLAPQAVGGLYFIQTPEGVTVFVSLVAMLMSAGYIHRHAPLSRLIGVCQVWWVLIIPWLTQQALAQETLSLFSVWLWYVTLTIIISLVMDIYGFHLYLTSENKSYREDD
ncbi:MAG: hypothetical protein AB3N20_13020 [Rhizobiaceae bacterium]